MVSLFASKPGISQISWQQTNVPYELSVYCLVINSSGHIFAGTYDGVFRSTNKGGIWTELGPTNSYVLSLAINSSGHIFAGTDGGRVFRSVNPTTNVK
jgi:ligand-binding sensor domain-containing protein